MLLVLSHPPALDGGESSQHVAMSSQSLYRLRNAARAREAGWVKRRSPGRSLGAKAMQIWWMSEWCGTYTSRSAQCWSVPQAATSVLPAILA